MPTRESRTVESVPPYSGHCLLVVLVLAAWALMTLPAFGVMPATDDWSASAPIASFSWHRMLPGAGRWLPFDHIFRVVAFWFPYPGYAHATNALGHLAAIGLVGILARECGGSHRTALFGALAYAITPAVGATVWSIDGENQIWSNVFGLLSATILICDGRRTKRAYAGWLILAMVSVLWNEGGIAWFAAAPLLKAFARTTGAIRGGVNSSTLPIKQAAGGMRQIYLRCRAELALGFLGVSAYFVARFLLLGKVELGTPGARYGVGLDPISMTAHAVMIIGTALSTIDTLALLSIRPTRWLAVLTLAMGLPLLGLLVWCAKKSWNIYQWLLAGSVSIAVVAPFCVMGHVSEMYGQRAAAVLAILLPSVVSGLDYIPAWLRWRQVSAALALLACMIGNTHKLVSMIRLGETSVAVGQIVAREVGPNVPDSICSVCEQGVGRSGYSVFEAPPGSASLCGVAAKMQWGKGRQVAFHLVSSADRCPHSDSIAIAVSLSGQVKRLW